MTIGLRIFIATLLIGLSFSISAESSESMKLSQDGALAKAIKKGVQAQPQPDQGDALVKAIKRGIQKHHQPAQVVALMFQALKGNVQALHQLRTVAQEGNKYAQYDLGSMYDLGIGVPQDFVQAFKWYLKSSEQGYAPAQSDLGSMYIAGEGVPQDPAQAVKWYRKAAEQGEVSSQFNLGKMYDDGEGVPHDDAQAFKWYRKAAEQGFATAQFRLAVKYFTGRGVLQNYVQALKWALISKGEIERNSKMPVSHSAVAKEVQAVSERIYESFVSATKAKLTLSQVILAQGMARRWLSAHPAVWP